MQPLMIARYPRKRLLPTWGWIGLGLLTLTHSAWAFHTTFSYRVDSVTVDGNINGSGDADGTPDLIESFGGPSLGPNWSLVWGSAMASSGLILANPGHHYTDSRWPGVILDQSAVWSTFHVVDGAGNASITAVWDLSDLPADNYNCTLFQILSGSNEEQVTPCITNLTPGIAAQIPGAPVGLSILQQHLARSVSSVLADTFETASVEGAFAGPVVMRVDFDDAANTVTSHVSVDGGSTFHDFTPVPLLWPSFGPSPFQAVVMLNVDPVTSVSGTTTTTTTTIPPPCGNGVIDPTEECDEGAYNGQSGHCCTTTCHVQPTGTSCNDEGDLCTVDTCDAAGVCTHTTGPASGCALPTMPQKASLVLRTVSPGRNQAQFKWAKGPAVPLADFGNPNSDLTQLCVFDQTGPSTYRLAWRGAPSASGGGTWLGSASGWKFKSTTGAPDGITGVTLKASTAPSKAKVQVKAKGNPAFPFGLPLQKTPGVVAQFKTSLGTCWGATFSTPKINTAVQFKAKSD